MIFKKVRFYWLKSTFYCYLPEDITGFKRLLNTLQNLRNRYKLLMISRISKNFAKTVIVRNWRRGNSQKLHN